MTDLPDPIEQAAYYQDVNLKRVIAWFIDSMAITFITFLISLLTLGIGFSFLQACGLSWLFSTDFFALPFILQP